MRSERKSFPATPVFVGRVWSVGIAMAVPVLLSLAVTGCGKSREASEAAPPVVQSTLIGSERAPDLSALHDTVMARALRGDTVGLLRLMVNDSVYREVVWPVTPAYEPDREEVWNLVMSMHKSNSNKGLRRLLNDITQAGSVMLRLPLSLTPVAGGTLHELPKTTRTESGVVLFASALCLDGAGCQVLSYAQGGQRGPGPADESEE